MARRVLVQRVDGKWGWRLEADNGQIIATDGSQGYENENDARTMADRVVSGYYSAAEKRIQRR
ncbi:MULTISPECIES: YegP family protein [unclassified Microbacterium]|uniref:YegP family protein n=1 Tax=Microbacterium TaxID=33882 RepID=UPI003BA327CE